MKKGLCLLVALMFALGMVSCKSEELPYDFPETGADAGNPLGYSISDEQLSPMLAYDDRNIKLTVNSLTRDVMRTTISVTLENDSNVPVSMDALYLSFNGMMMEHLNRMAAEPGQVVAGTIEVLQSTITKAGVEVIGLIECYLQAYDASEATTTDKGKTIGEPTYLSLATSAGQKNAELALQGNVMLDKSGVKVTVLGLANGYNSKDVVVFCENNSQHDISIITRYAVVDGVEVTPLMACELPKGKKGFDKVKFSGSKLDNVTNYKNLAFGYHVIDLFTGETIFDTDPEAVPFEGVNVEDGKQNSIEQLLPEQEEETPIVPGSVVD